MSLPKISMPLFQENLPSDNRKIYYRPFTVKEEKILLMAQESDDFHDGILAIKQVLNNCITSQDDKDFDISNLPMFDLEYMLLKLRTRSVDNMLELTIKDGETGKKIDVQVDINEMKLVRYPDHSNKIKINDEYTLMMKYPTIDILHSMADKDLTEAEKSYNVMLFCLDKLVSEDTVYNFKDETEEGIIEFLDDLDPKTIVSIKKFFETIPRIRHEVKYTNELGNEKTFVIEGTETFFL